MPVHKPSVRRGRPAKKNASEAAPSGGKRKLYRPSGSVGYSVARGKVLRDVYLTMQSNFNCITLTFEDNTDLTFEIESGVAVTAQYCAWKSGEGKVIRDWPRVRNL